MNFPKINSLIGKKDFVYVITLFVVIGLICFLFYELSKKEVTFVQDDEERTLQTHANTVGDVLKELAIQTNEQDDLSYELNEIVQSGMIIEYTEAKTVAVSVDGEIDTYYTTEPTVGDFLASEGFQLTKHDKVSETMEQEIYDKLAITIQKAFPITVMDAKKAQEVWITGGTVNELLNKYEIELKDLDRVQPSLDTALTASDTVEITRVEKVTDVVAEEQSFSVVKKSDDTLKKGTEKVVEEGEPGVIEKHYEVILENGEEVDRKLIKEAVKKEAKEKVVAIGTKVEVPQATTVASKPQKSSSPNLVSRSGKESSGKTLYMRATAYNWDCNSCDGRGLTSTGYNLKNNPHGVIAVDPNVIPLGTRVYIEGYGHYVARDTGGAVKGNKIDIHMPTKKQAINFGGKNVKVTILD